MGTRVQSDHADLRGQLVVMLVLALAIALRSVYLGGGETSRRPRNVLAANEAQHDATNNIRYPAGFVCNFDHNWPPKSFFAVCGYGGRF